MDDILAFGELARKRRMELNLTQEALAAAALANMDRKGYISNVEQGKLPTITPSTIKKICDVLEIKLIEVPPSLRWQEPSSETPQNSVQSDVISSSSLTPKPAPLPTSTATAEPSAFNKSLLGLGTLICIVAFSEQITHGISAIGASIWVGGKIAPLAFFIWCAAILTLVFYFFGLEGQGAFTRAKWLERGAWQDRYLNAVNHMLAVTDRWFLTKSQRTQLPPNSIYRNWSVGLYEKAWAFAIVYPSALLLFQWVVTGSGQQLGFVQLWPEETDALRRAFICLCFLLPLPMSFFARVQSNKMRRIGICILALALNMLGTAYIWSIYWNVQVGPGAINMITTAIILGVGLRLFDSVASAAGAAAIAGASLSLFFLPLVDLAEFITGREGLGYNDRIVNVAHTIMNHSLNLVLFFISLTLISKVINSSAVQEKKNYRAMTYLVISIGAAALMIFASSQEFWFPYYFIIGLLPLVNAAFDFMSIGLTRLTLRRGAQQFGSKTLIYSVVDLFGAAVLFLGLIVTTIYMAIGLNWMIDQSAFPFQAGSAACLSGIDSTFSTETHISVKGLLAGENECSDSIINDANSEPWKFMWLILIFGSTLLPTLLHFGFALFALGPALLNHRVRMFVANWARRSAKDPFLRGAASMFFGVWLATVVTLIFLAIEYSSSALKIGFSFVSQVAIHIVGI